MKTHTFRCVFANSPHYRIHLKTLFKVETFENGALSYLVWTAKMEAFGNADVIHITNIAGASFVACADDCGSVFEGIEFQCFSMDGKNAAKAIVWTRSF